MSTPEKPRKRADTMAEEAHAAAEVGKAIASIGDSVEAEAS